MTDFYLARQPIHDKHNELLGYDLLFHSNELNKPLIPSNAPDPAQILVSALLEMGLTEVVGNKLAFINLTKRYVLGEFPIPLARKQIVLEIHQDILPGHVLLNAFKQLKLRNSYTLALDAFNYDPAKISLVPLVDYVKVDIRGLNQEQIQQQLELLGRFQGKRMAVGVNDYACFDVCRDLGFDYFQGFYFCQTHFNLKHPLPTEKSAALNLFRELHSPGLTQTRLQNITARDISLGNRILRFLNSSKFNLARTVSDIPQAIGLVGFRCIANWITLLVMARINDKADELMTITLQRARMCEALGRELGLATDNCFSLGLVSTLDALLDMSFSDIQIRLPLTADIYIALHNQPTASAADLYRSHPVAQDTLNLIVEDTGHPLTQLLQCVIAYERSDWENPLLQRVPKGQLTEIYFEAITWASAVRHELLSPL